MVTREVPLNPLMESWMQSLNLQSARSSNWPPHFRFRSGPLSPDWADEPDFVVTQNINVLDIRKELGSLNAKLSRLERLVREQQELLLVLSQSYYWTPEWQEKEKRADVQLREGEGITFETAEDLIRHLRSLS